MYFNSYIFILAFLPVFVVGYHFLNNKALFKLSLVWICVMSFLFYGYANINFLLLLLFSCAFNFGLVNLMQRFEANVIRKTITGILILFNLGILFWFKYYNFTVFNVNQLFGKNHRLLEVVLPIGISFITFQQISYVIDCYRDNKRKISLLDYFVYISFFPKLSSGPITLGDDLFPQLENLKNKKVNFNNILIGIYLFVMGLGKKVLLADTISKIVNAGFDAYHELGSMNTALILVLYSLQIYFDFSGYSDMALGIAKMLNINLPVNFLSPYKATSIKEFWNRWHITLSKFFAKYIYIPLGGSKKGDLKKYSNTMIVFLISGIWHGANWTFVVWGALNGILVVIDNIMLKYKIRIHDKLSVVRTFIVTTLLWGLFRSDSLTQYLDILKNFLKFKFEPINIKFIEIFNELVEVRILARFGLQKIIDFAPMIPFLLFFILCLCMVFGTKNLYETVEHFEMNHKRFAMTTIVLLMCIVSLADISQFLYFSF